MKSAMKYLGLWSPRLQIFFEKFVKPSGSPPTYLMYAPLYKPVKINLFLLEKNRVPA